jgi:endonuclease/exonuclease/phosphatase (EEP) superfamily protein YafD
VLQLRRPYHRRCYAKEQLHLPREQRAQSHRRPFFWSAASVLPPLLLAARLPLWRRLGSFTRVTALQAATEGCTKLGASFRVELLQLTSRLIQLQVCACVCARQQRALVTGPLQDVQKGE